MFGIQCLKALQPLKFHFLRSVIGHLCSRSTRARRIDEGETGIELHVLNQFHCFFEIFRSFVRETYDEVCSNTDIRTNLAEFSDDRFVLENGIAALHTCQNSVASCLNRQVNVIGKFRNLSIGFDQSLREFFRVRSCITDTFDPFNFSDIFEKKSKIHNFTVRIFSAVGINILTEKSYFFNALFSKLNNFKQNILQRTGEFFSACVGHNTVRTVFAAAFHNGNECRCRIGVRFRQMVKLLNLWEADIYLRTVSFLAFFEQLRKSVIGLRPEYDINVRGSANNIFALLTGNTTPDSNFQLGFFFFQFSCSA